MSATPVFPFFRLYSTSASRITTVERWDLAALGQPARPARGPPMCKFCELHYNFFKTRRTPGASSPTHMHATVHLAYSDFEYGGGSSGFGATGSPRRGVSGSPAGAG